MAEAFGPYCLLEALATGGMGEVFLALDPRDDLCVIKRILSGRDDDPEFQTMFVAEGRLLERFDHPHIARVHRVGEVEGRAFIEMEYVPGIGLRELLDVLEQEGKRLPGRLALDVTAQVLDGLDHAHQGTDGFDRPLSVVHKDVNPQNVLLDWNGDVRLIDFGIAHSEEEAVEVGNGTVKGKFAYMSPEQSAAEPLDRRSDIFSSGILLRQLATLENPFARPQVILTLEAIQSLEPEPLARRFPELAALDPVLRKALRKEPDRRYATAKDMRRALADVRPRLPEAPQSLAEVIEHFFGARRLGMESRLGVERLDRAVVRRRNSTPPSPMVRRGFLARLKRS
ncbi:MAG: serine/threonine-protein kinase [Myxococcota bacterium]